MWEQLENVAQLQYYWADNQVSVTISFSEQEKAQLQYALELYETRLKGVSFLPKQNHGYAQAPYIPITKEQYDLMVHKIKVFEPTSLETHEQIDEFCDSDKCVIQKQ